MSLTLNLGSASISGESFSANSKVVINNNTYSIDSDKNVLTLGNIGKLNLSDTGKDITFTAGSDFSGEFKLGTSIGSGSASVVAVDFSKAGGAVTFDTANASDVVSITGSDYNDKLTSNVNGASINGGDGDDVITFSGVSASISGGKDNDKINVTGKNASVSISDDEGDDSYIISGEGAHVTINDDNGADSLKITGKDVIADVSLSGNDNNAVTIDSAAVGIKANISVAGGDDTIVSKANNATLDINSAAGDDVITISGQNSAVSINAGAGDDVITVSGKESSVSIDAGAGDDVIDITKADKSKITIATGDGDNTVKISAATVSGSVTGGAGTDDTLVIAGANANLSVSAVENVNLTGKNGFVSVTGGTVNSSADGATINAATVNVTGGTAVLEAAATELNISKGSVTAKAAVTATVAGGTFTSGKDVGDVADVITVSGYGANVNTGKGADSITVSEDAYGTNTLTLGDGNDQVTVAAGKGKVVITDLDSNNDKLILTDASEDTVVSLSKNGVLNVVDAGQYNVTATVISGDYASVAGDYDTAVKNKAKNNYFYASVTGADNNVTELYTASGTTKKVSINTSNDSNLKVDLSAAKSSEVTLGSTTKNTWVTLGNGEDKVSIASGAKNVTISNYNFANKDAIKFSVDASDVILHNDGVLTTGIEADGDYEDAKLMVSTTANGGVYAARLNDVDYYTAKSGAVKIATDKKINTSFINVAKASSSTINIAAGEAIIKDLTAGADVINVAAGASVDASNAVYKYAQNDVINLGKAKDVSVGNVTLSETDDGEKILKTVISAKNGSSIASAVSVAAAVDKNGLYMAKVVSNNNKDTKTFVAADEDANVKIDLSAAAYGNVHFDALDAAAANVTIGAGDRAELSNGEDVITVTGLTSTTKENVIIDNFSAADDKLVLNKIKLADLTFTSLPTSVGVGDFKIGYGSKKAAVIVDTDTTGTTGTVANININGTNVMADLASVGSSLELNEDSKNAFFIGNKNTSLKISDEINNTTINLGDANKYKDVHTVVVDAEATGITIVGTDSKKTGDSVDASKNEYGVQVNLGAGNDSVTLSKGADVVWFNAKQGKDVISDFTYGVGDTADILNITDVKSLDKIKLGKATGGITVKDGSAVATIKTAAPVENSSEVMKIQLGKKVYNVATDLNSDGNIALDLDDEIKVDTYLGKKLKVSLNSDDGVAYTYNKAVSKDDIASINGSASNGAMKIYGVNTVTLGTSEEANANQVWAKGAGTINTANDYAGNDQVWFQGGVDKKVLVNGFASYSADNDANDNIKLVGTKSLANIVANYKFASKDGDMVITNIKNSTSKLTVDDKDTVVLTDDANATYVVKVGTKDNGAEFTSDVNIYAGMSELSSSNIEDKTTIMLDGGSGNKFGYKSNYYIDSTVKKFDGSGSSGDLILVGSKNAKSELIGGDGNDVLYGGGAFNDTLKGGDGNNTFYFGANDGHDVIDGITENDTIRLYSGKLADPKLLGKYNESKDVFTFTFTDGSTLTVNGDVADGTKLVYGKSTYRYQSDNHKFIRVK